jgi:hypothetical protein
MDAADLFDVIHVLYEEDITPLWEQHIDVKDRVREVLYPQLYNRPYKFASTKARRPDGIETGPTDPDGFPEGVGESRETKPYIPPTDPEDLMKVLGAPMGG